LWDCEVSDNSIPKWTPDCALHWVNGHGWRFNISWTEIKCQMSYDDDMHITRNGNLTYIIAT